MDVLVCCTAVTGGGRAGERGDRRNGQNQRARAQRGETTYQVAAVPLGGVRALADDAIAPLLAARAKAGLGRAADAAVKLAADLVARPPDSRGAKPVVACAPAPHSAVPTIGPGGGPTSTGGDELAAIVRDEIVRALRG